MSNRTLEVTPIKWVQDQSVIRERNNKARAYSKSVQRNHKAKRNEKIYIALAMLTCFAAFFYVTIDAFELYPIQAATTEMATEVEQEYVVRYGNVDGFLDNGDMIIVTEDDNEWILQDAPCYANGTELRILFDSNLTTIATDDAIIDITER